MSCPDPTPESGSIQDLEWQAEQAKKRLIAKKDEEYIASGRLLEDIENLLQTFGASYSYGPKPETLEEKFKAGIKKAKETNSQYYDKLWEKR